tara:strand:+ start:66 stop:440 length:375 start_codon:yes stop_codon:yes gene_type:complete
MENKTVTYKGKVYEIGAPYLFSERDKEWVYGILTDVDCNYKKPFCTNEQVWDHIKEVPSATNGTITPVPLELIHGNAYTFSHPAYQKPVVGIYNAGTERFIASNLATLTRTCTGIREMTVKESC